MNTTNALDDRFDDAERGLEWLEPDPRPTRLPMKLLNT